MLKKLKKKDMVNIKMKTKVEDINRNIYDIKNEDNYDFKMEKGINEEIVKEISKQKNEPEWMLEIRLKALETYKKMPPEEQQTELLETVMELLLDLPAKDREVIMKMIKAYALSLR